MKYEKMFFNNSAPLQSGRMVHKPASQVRELREEITRLETAFTEFREPRTLALRGFAADGLVYERVNNGPSMYFYRPYGEIAAMLEDPATPEETRIELQATLNTLTESGLYWLNRWAVCHD